MRASPDQWLHHTGAPRHLQATIEGTPSPHRSHKKGFSTVLINTHKDFIYSHHKDHIPHFLNGLSLNMLFKLKVLLEKRHRSLRREQGGPKHTIIILLIQVLFS